MEYLFERFHGVVGQETSRLNEKAGHFFLPTLVDVALGHAGTGPFKVFRFQVANQQSVWTQEQGVVVPPCFTQSRQHLVPHAAVASLVFVQPIGSYLENEANTLHLVTPRLRKAPQQKKRKVFRAITFYRKKASDRPPSTGITCPVVLAL